jgi:hypothetical protein
LAVQSIMDHALSASYRTPLVVYVCLSEASSDGKLAFCVAPCAAPLSLAALETRSQWVELDAKRKTPNLIISPEQLEVCCRSLLYCTWRQVFVRQHTVVCKAVELV